MFVVLQQPNINEPNIVGLPNEATTPLIQNYKQPADNSKAQMNKIALKSTKII